MGLRGFRVDPLEALVELVRVLSDHGIIDLRELILRLEAINTVVFSCDRRLGRGDYESMARALRDQPIIIECERRRASYIRRRLSMILGEEVLYERIGRRIHPVYVLYTRGSEGQVRSLVGGA